MILEVFLIFLLLIIDTALLHKSKIVNAPEDASPPGRMIFIHKSFFYNEKGSE